jgi:hypothetical protein
MHFQGRAESGADYAPQYELRIAYPSDNPENIDSVLRRMRKPDLALRVFTVKVMAGHLKYSAWCSHAMCIIAFVRLMYEKHRVLRFSTLALSERSGSTSEKLLLLKPCWALYVTRCNRF